MKSFVKKIPTWKVPHKGRDFKLHVQCWIQSESWWYGHLSRNKPQKILPVVGPFESGVPNPQLTRQKIALKVCPCNIRAVQQILLLDQEARSRYHMDFLIQTGVISDKDWFTLNRNVNNCINIQWYSEYLHAVDEVPLYDLKFGVWCAVSACKIIGHLFFRHSIFPQLWVINSETILWRILTP